MGAMWSNNFPPTPTFTEKDLPDLKGKVYIVTGGASGVGQELVRILYGANAKVYIAGRSAANGDKAIETIKGKTPQSAGELAFLHLDLNDLTGIKKSAEEFLSKEKRLDVLFNNAGVMIPPQGSQTAQGYELQLGTNCVAPFLFTKLLTPLLLSTAQTGADTRIVWVSSSVAEMASHNPGGVDMSNLDYKTDRSIYVKYGISKAGNYLHGSEFAKRFPQIKSVSLNPGNLKTPLQRHVPGWQMLMANWILYDPKFGAYTELFAGLSPAVTSEKTGSWIQPWGRFVNVRPDLALATKTEAEGGSGVAEKFWEWSEEQVKAYL